MKIERVTIGNLAAGFGRIIRIALITFIVSAMAISAKQAWAQAAATGEGVAAIVNDQPITSFDLRQRTRFLLITSGITQATPEIVQQASQQALSQLINERLQIQEAAKFKVYMGDADVDRILANQARQNGQTLEAFYTELLEAGISIQSYRDKTRAEVLWQRIVSGRYGSRIKISRGRIDEFLNRVLATSNRPQYQMSEIFIEVANSTETEEALAGAATLVGQIRSGASFARIAQQFSFASTAASGGDLGWVIQGELRPEVAAIIEQVPVGQVSDPISVQGGVMIFAIRAKREGQVPLATYKLKEMSKTVAADASETVWRHAEEQVRAAKTGLRGGCDGVTRAAARNNISALDLGQVAATELSEVFNSNLQNLRQNQSTNVFRSPQGVHVLVVCDVVLSGPDIPTREQIEDQLTDQELSLIARRYLRDLRREAAVNTRF